ncbi:hypothetical protein BO86DRAFT_148628 [Aspergillus japonicus CBS 114.51]|uniref:Uncharacterized protein n=2 Tax=Aspergillus TaxID=5052 RepID=A0A2V5I0S7_ASPV1|nr:hypothetical protein BO86DRAFT_148628 [Aspergillus japonicus CBS 114.51]PYI13316.1 hypothetical protein BO99DRAFT_63344 [Aspergillus violaceofuscus CBS 115571]RAH79689.1 hypothetical protein BO86DRAFT_148628 [Aspergillus japonicus CBS 114.51]
MFRSLSGWCRRGPRAQRWFVGKGGCRDHPSACASATLRIIDNLEVIDGASKQGIINAFCTAGRGDSLWALGRMAHCSIIEIAIVNPRAVGRAGITATYQRQPASDHPDNSSHHATVSVISRRIGRPDHRSATVDVPGDLHQQSNCSIWYHGLAGELSSDLLRCIPTAPGDVVVISHRNSRTQSSLMGGSARLSRSTAPHFAQHSV